ncbi:MAG: hypothetical protein EZS28_037474 [Streblomastix strix]|uniref:Uncharacterized protein n=1 Tax=Streblomastix strix TaxID=222440 RepID=A0A5J4UAS1_9EUKA|nr:MAG: hypothetical protein EZS28_037474 [Streblomastix strix]
MESTQQRRDTRHNFVDQQVSPQSTIVLHETQQVNNNPDRCFELRMGATLIREIQEKVFAHVEWRDNNLKSSNQREVTAVLKAFLKFRQELIQQQPIGIQLLKDNKVTMYCLNNGKGSITIDSLVDKVLKLTACQGFDPPIFDKDNPRFLEKLDALKTNMQSKLMAFEDLNQRFPAMNNIFSKTETQQKMTYAQVAISQEDQLRFIMEHSPRA